MNKQEELYKFLKEVKLILDNHNVRFWLECGTLLGAIRDSAFIPWEKDIDFSTWRHEVSDETIKSIIKSLQDQKFSVWMAQSHMNVRDSGQCHLDINFYEIDGDKALMPAYMPGNIFGKILNICIPSLMAPRHPRDIAKLNKTSRFIVKSSVAISKLLPIPIRNNIAKILNGVYQRYGAKDISWVVPLEYFSDFSMIDFYGMQFYVPANVKNYLEFRYGSDWETPTQNWIHHENDGACQESSLSMVTN